MTSTATAIALTGMSSTSSSKTGYFKPIYPSSASASYNANCYASFSFTVADNYKFTPSSLSLTLQGYGTSDRKAKVVITDGANSIESSETSVSNGSDTNVTISNTGSTYMTGTVTIRIHLYGLSSEGSGKRTYIKKPVSITGDVASTAPATAPTITTQPTSGVYVKDASVSLTVAATASAGTCSYQWYSCEDAEGTNESSLGEGAREATYAVPTGTAGNYYYFCRVTDDNGSTDTDVARVRIAPTAAVSTWDITTLQERDVQYNTDFWTNGGTYTYTHAGVPSGTTIEPQNNFGTGLMGGISLGRTGGDGTITLFIDNTNNRYGIGVMGDASKPGTIKVPVESGHYYRITYCSSQASKTLGYAVSGADVIGENTATLANKYTSTAAFVAKATSSEMTLSNTGEGANYVMLVKIEEVEALNGAWSSASNTVIQGGASPSIPTFTVTPSNGGSATLGTEYSVSYELKEGSTAGLLTVDGSDGITSISTGTVGTATVTATVTDLIDTDNFVVETATYEYVFTVEAPVAPTISVTPASSTVEQNATVTLTAAVEGTPAPTIQWYSNTTASNDGGVAIDGATSTTYSPSTSDYGTRYYYAKATNSAGTATSAVATVKVAEFAPIFSAKAKTAYSVPASTNEAPYTDVTSYATMTGGSIYAHNGQDTPKGLVGSSSFAFTNNNTNFKVVLNSALQVGDIISSKVGNNKDYGIKIYTTENLNGYGATDETYDAIILNTTGKFGAGTPYQVKSTDTNLIGATTLYIYRATGNSTYFDELTVSREVLTPGTVTFDPAEGTIAPATEITLASSRATTIKYQWGSAAVDDAEDASWSSAETYADDNKPAAPAAGSTNNVLSVLATNTYGSVTGSATYTIKAASDLALVNGNKLAVKGTSDISYTFTESVDFTTSSDGAITLTSSNSSVATVDGTDGMKINFVDDAVGITTITLTQAETAAYDGGSIQFTVAATGTHATPAATLDFSNASSAKTTLTGTWFSDKPYYGNDGTSNYMAFSPWSGYQSTASQTWINQPKSGSSGPSSLTGNWSATGVFLGNTVYPVNMAAQTGGNAGKARYASINATRSATDADNRRATTWHAYQVKGITKAQILANATNASNNIMLAAYEVDGGVAAATSRMDYVSGNANKVATVDGLDENKTYLVTISTDRTSNVYFYEAAFFFPTDLGITETITPANDKSTYVTRSSMDFSGVDGLKAYVATDNDASSVKMASVDQVPGGTPLMLVGTASTPYEVPVGSAADAPETNNLRGGQGASVTFDGSTYDYILFTDGKFYQIGSGSVAVNKAYLHLDDAPADARALSVSFDDEITTGVVELKNSKVEEMKSYYNLSGQKVQNPTKGMYIVNGKKVLVP